MSDRTERILVIALAFVAVAMVGFVAADRLGAPRRSRAVTQNELEFVPAWREALPIGIRIGSASAPVTIIELADFECPACAEFQQSLEEVARKFPVEVALVHVHYPLKFHRFAEPAARASECAFAVGKFSELGRAFYRGQDSLGLKSWGSYAKEAGISDTAMIVHCAMDPHPVQRITAGHAFGQKIAIKGTPTILANGWRFSVTPSVDQMEHVVRALLDGNTPAMHK